MSTYGASSRPGDVESLPIGPNPPIGPRGPSGTASNLTSTNTHQAQEQAPNKPYNPPARLRLLHGFPRSARFLAADPDRSWVILRRFEEASIRNLLLLEARVAALEEIQKELDREDYEQHKKNDAVRTSARSWETFALLGANSHEDIGLLYPAMEKWINMRETRMRLMLDQPDTQTGNSGPQSTQRAATELSSLADDLISLEKSRLNQELSPESRVREERKHLGFSSESIELVKRRWQVSQALQGALQAYGGIVTEGLIPANNLAEEALIRYGRLSKLDKPASRTESVVVNWLSGILDSQEKPIPEFPSGSAMNKAYGPNGAINDRVGLGTIGANDRLSRWLAKRRWLMKYGIDEDFEYPQIDYVPESWLMKVVTSIILIFAAIWVVGAVWFLWLVQNRGVLATAQLGLLTFFVATFGLALTFGTTANRAEVFGATAAYAAVLVVFIGAGASPDTTSS